MPSSSPPRFRLRTLLLWMTFVAVACAACAVIRNGHGVLIAVLLSGYICRQVWERGRQEE